MNIPDKLTEYAGRYAKRDFRMQSAGFPYTRALVCIVFSAFILRLMIGAGYLNSYDTEWNIMWGVQLGDGFLLAYNHVNELDYPPLYLYPLWLVGRLVSIPRIGGYPPFRMLAIKFFPCLADSLTCAVLYRLTCRRNKKLGLLAASLWAVNPAVVFNCACWGQTDCVMIFMASLLMLALEEKHVLASGVLWAALFSTKLQGLYLTPVVGMEVLTVCFGSLHPKEFSLSAVRKPAVTRFCGFIFGAAYTLVLIYLPFMIGSGLSPCHGETGFFAKFFRPITVYSEGVAKYPYCTLNGDNIYALFGLNGVKDDLQILPGLRVSTVGTVFLLLSMAGVVAVYVFGRRRSHWLAGFLFMECVFMLTCRQHERYQIIVLLLLIGACTRLADRRLLTLFSLQSLAIFFNQFRVLSAVRENTNWWRYYKYAGSTAGWVGSRDDYMTLNALLNVILFIASMVFVLRYYFDPRSDEPAVSRAVERMADRRSKK